MRIAAAYIVAILCAPFIGMLPGFVVALLFSWVPDRIGVPLRTLLGACTAVLFAVGFGFLVFRWIVGVDSFGVLPYLGTIVPVCLLMIKNYGQYQRMKQISNTAPDSVKGVLAPEVLGAGTYILGQVAGIFVGGYLFIEWPG